MHVAAPEYEIRPPTARLPDALTAGAELPMNSTDTVGSESTVRWM